MARSRNYKENAVVRCCGWPSSPRWALSKVFNAKWFLDKFCKHVSETNFCGHLEIAWGLKLIFEFLFFMKLRSNLFNANIQCVGAFTEFKPRSKNRICKISAQSAIFSPLPFTGVAGRRAKHFQNAYIYTGSPTKDENVKTSWNF